MGRIAFTVKTIDSQSLARSGVLKVGSKSIDTPFRWAPNPQGSEEHALATALPGTPNPFGAARLLTRRLIHATVKNIEESNGKSQKLTSSVMAGLGAREQDNVLRAFLFRWNKSSVWRGAEIPHRTMSEKAANAVFAFGIPLDVDLHIPPIPSQVDRFDVFKRVVDAYVASAETFHSDRPILGYIPNVESLSLAEKMIAYYDDQGCDLFGIDLAGGHPFQLISTVVRYLRIHRGNRYYLHAFNVRQTRPSEADITPIEDLLKLSYGFDSFSRVAFGGGGGTDEEPPPDTELIGKLRFVNMPDYGAYRPAALHRAKPGVKCVCRVCEPAGSPLKLLDGDYELVQSRVKAHGVLVERDEFGRIRKAIGEGRFRKSLGEKTQAVAPLRAIDSEVSRIKAKGIDE
jgi:hypothetical protein